MSGLPALWVIGAVLLMLALLALRGLDRHPPPKDEASLSAGELRERIRQELEEES